MKFPRRYRLARRDGFSPILLQRALAQDWFAVHSKANTVGHARLGISVSKRILPAANRRNAAKRLIRECFRQVCRGGQALDVVVRLRRPLDPKNGREARVTLGEMLNRALATK